MGNESTATGTAVEGRGSPTSTLPKPIAVAAGLPVRVDKWFEARRRLAWVLTTVLLGVVAAIVVVPAATGLRGGVSPVDEYVYTDALDKADRGEFSNTGDKVDQYARQVMVCRGVVGLQPPSPEICGSPLPDGSVPLGGYTSADIHPPTYFFLTAGVAKVIRAVGLTDDLLTSGRLAGALWLSLGMLALVALARAWGAGWVMPVLTAAAIGCSPLLVSVSGYVSPDSMGLMVGAGVLLAVRRWQEERLPHLALLAVAVLPAFVKVPFVLAPLFSAVLLVVAAAAGQATWRRTLTGSAILVAGAGAGAVMWQELRGLLAVDVPFIHPDAAPPGFRVFYDYFGYYLDSVPINSGAPLPVTYVLTYGAQPLPWLLLGAALGGVFLLRREDPVLPVAWAGMAGMVLGSIVLSFIVFLASGGFLVGTPRYGLALLPMFAVPLMCTRHPVAVLGILGSAGVSVLAHVLLW